MPTKLMNEILTAAIDGFEAQRRRIDDQIAEIRQMLDGGPKPDAAGLEQPKRKRRKMSAAGRRAIIEASKRRWALIRAEASKAEKAHPRAAKEAALKRAVNKLA
jgi:hypothetical protein